MLSTYGNPPLDSQRDKLSWFELRNGQFLDDTTLVRNPILTTTPVNS